MPAAIEIMDYQSTLRGSPLCGLGLSIFYGMLLGGEYAKQVVIGRGKEYCGIDAIQNARKHYVTENRPFNMTIPDIRQWENSVRK